MLGELSSITNMGLEKNSIYGEHAQFTFGLGSSGGYVLAFLLLDSLMLPFLHLGTFFLGHLATLLASFQN